MRWGPREIALLAALGSVMTAPFLACSSVLGLGDFAYAPGGDGGSESGPSDGSSSDGGDADVVRDVALDSGAGGDAIVLYQQGAFGLMCTPWTTTITSAMSVQPEGGPPGCRVCGYGGSGGNISYRVDIDAALSGTFQFTTLVAADPTTDEGGTFSLYAVLGLDFPDAAPAFPSSNPTVDAALFSTGVAKMADGVTGVTLEIGGAPGGTPDGQCFFFAQPEVIYVPGP